MRTARESFSLGSLKVRLALASAVLILASVALTVLFVLREVGRATEQIVLASQEDDAQRLAATISQRLISLQRALRSVALRLPLAALDDPARLSDLLQKEVVLSTLFSSVFVVALDGTILVVNDDRGARNPNTNVSDRDYFRNTLRDQRPMIDRVATSRVSGEPIVILTMPVFAADGRVGAVLGGSLRLSSRSLLDDLIQGKQDRSSPVATIVVDAKGRILGHPAREWLLRDGAAEPTIAAALQDWRSRGSPIEPTGFALRSGDHEVGMAGVPDADWLVLRTGRADALLGGVLHGEQRARWLAFGVALGGGALTLLITVYLLRPMARLKQRPLYSGERGWG